MTYKKIEGIHIEDLASHEVEVAKSGEASAKRWTGE